MEGCTYEIISVLILCYVVSLTIGDVKTSPKRIMKLKGDAAVLRCISTSSIPNYPIQWTHLKVGAPVSESSFVYFQGQLYESYDHGRHSVVVNESLRTYDLVIKNLSLDDAGTYTCAHVLESSDRSDIKIVIMESPPRCTSNISLANVLVDNDCGLSPDYMDLTCRIRYSGNIAPVLQWRHSAEPYVIISTSKSQPQAESVTSLNISLKPDIKINGTNYICSVDGFELDGRVVCKTPHIGIAYIFKPSAMSDTGDTASCIANTSSRHCEYRWRGTYVPSNGTIESFGQKLQLDEHLNYLRCVTECDIGDVKCAVTSDVLPRITKKKEGHTSEIGIVFVIPMVISIAFVVAVIITLKRKLFLSFIKCDQTRQQTGSEVEHRTKQQTVSEVEHRTKQQTGSEVELRTKQQTGSESELRTLLPPASAAEAIAAFDCIDPQSESYSTLVECLDAVNGLADYAYSKGLLTEHECQLLTNKSSYEKHAGDLLEMLIPRMNEERNRRKFLDALIETDQIHVYNFIIKSTACPSRILNHQELASLQIKYPCLLNRIKSTDGFLERLVKSKSITVQQLERVKQHTSTIERNRELLAIMKRRNFAHFQAFIDVLKKTKQTEVVQALQGQLLPDEDQRSPYKRNQDKQPRFFTRVAHLIVIILYFGNLRLICAEVKTSPKELIKLEGDTAILHCVSSSNPAGPLEWKHLKLGTSAQEAEYVFFNGQFYEPYDGGRHSVVFKESPKTLDLNITTLSLEDAGTYICSNVLNTTDHSDIELTILESPPRCSTNVSLENVLVENDCNLTPDYFELNCSIGYRGKVVPVLLWSHSSHPDIILTTSNSQPQSNKVTSLSHPIKPAYDMNGTYFICSIEGVEFEPDDSTCSTQNITVDYIFPPKATRLSSSVDRATCIANTSSERCDYRWRGKHFPSNSTIVSYGQILQLDEHMNNLHCVTECEIHRQKCIVTSHLLPELTADVDNEYFIYRIILVAVVVIAICVLLTIVVNCIIKRKSKSFLSFLRDCFRRHPTENVCENSEQRVLVDHQNVSDNFIQNHSTTLMACLDAVNGLPDELYSKGVLTEGECHQLENESSYEKRTQTLLKILKPRMESESRRKFFLEALMDTDQKHVCEYLTHFKDSGRNTSNRILNKCELDCIQRNYPHLLNLINSKNSFLDQLFKHQCITERQKDRIKQQPDKIRRNRELLAIMKRRSFAHFETFKTVLNKTQQRNLVKILNDMHGSVGSLHCEVDMENQSREAIIEVEQQICDSINDPQQLSHRHQQIISMHLRPLTNNGVELVGASPSGSIHFYFLCKSLEAVTFFKRTCDSGEMKTILKSFLEALKSVTSLTLDVSLDVTEYRRILKDVRENMYYNKGKKKIIRPPFTLLPEEMLELILQKSFVRSWSNALKSYAPKDIETGGYALFQKFVSSEGKVVYINLKSVMFKWKDTCSVQGLLRLAIIKRLRECSDTLVQGLNCQHGLLDSLVVARVINYEEEKEISGKTTGNTDKSFPAPNKQLITCVSDKSFKEINKFLKQMDAMKLGHLLNYSFCSEKLRAFDESWPLDDVTRECIANSANKLIQSNISITEKTIGYVPTTQTCDILPRGMILLDILCDRGCISSTHKRYIEEQPTGEFRRAALFQMLVTGSIKTYKTTIAYLRDTDQYVELVQHILVPCGKEITKVAWLENKIYVACYRSSIIYVYSDEEPFDRLEEEEIDITGILLPYDIAACNMNRVIYISDRVNKTLWKIQLAEGDQSPKLSKRSVDGEPIDLFVMASGDLLLTVEHEKRRRLEIYSPEDFNRPKTILISEDVHHAWHAVELSSGTFVVASRSVDLLRVGRAYFLQEISGDGEVLRSFESTYEHESITPFHLAVDSKDNIWFCDALKKAIFVLDLEWKNLQISLTEEKHGVKEPERVCFVPGKNLLLVGNRSSVVSIFNLQTHNV